jgi:hypothetical protein
MEFSKSSDHNKLITKAAKEMLIPLGCKQKGRSRLWYDDQGWFVIIIEFQPSSFGKGSYLNVGVTWLWIEKDYWSFDEGGRVENFKEYRDETTFLYSAFHLASRAAEEVKKYRNQFTNLKNAADYLTAKKNKNVWDLLDTSIACELAGYFQDSTKYFSELIFELQHPGVGADLKWINDLLTKVKELESQLGQPDEFRIKIVESIQKSRILLKLNPLQNPFKFG